MKAVVLQANGKLVVEERPKPVPQADEVLVQVSAIGVCSSDIARGFGGGAYHYPLVMGHEFGGKVSAIGASAGSRVKVGDSVSVFPLLPCFKCAPCAAKRFAQCEKYSYYGSRQDGAYAEFIAVKEWNLVPVNPKVAIENIAAFEPVSVVLHALSKIQKHQSLDSVLILGCGYLGLIAVQMIRRMNPSAQIQVVDRNLFKLKIAEKLGAKTFHLAGESEWQQFLKDNDSRFPVVLESSGSEITFANSIPLTARSGVTMWMGNITNDLTMSKKLVSSVLRKELTILGTWNSDYNGAAKSDWTEARDLFESGFSITPLITHTIGFAELPAILEKMYRHKQRQENFEHVKVVVKV